jgi:hypothetical protein
MESLPMSTQRPDPLLARRRGRSRVGPVLPLLSLAAGLLGALAFAGAALGATAVGSEFQVNTYATGWQHEPAVAVDADGDFVVVW